MFRIVGTGLLSLLALGMASSGHGQEQAGQRARAGQGANAPGAGAVTIPGANDVLATVTSHNQTGKVTRGEVVGLLSRYALPPVDEREISYTRAIELLVNFQLLNQYLTSQRVEVPPAKIDEQIAKMEEQMKRENQPGLATLLDQNGSSMDDLRKELATKLRWSEFSKTKAQDATLRKFLNENRDRFSGTRVRASHILLSVKPNASKEEKDQVRQKLEAIRKEILAVRMTFPAAANKYSDDPANTGGAGGDLDYFTLDSGFVEEFAEAAFKLKKGEISEPVETPFGIHLIQVTDRQEGRLPDFEKSKPYIAQAYDMQLQKQIVTAERKTAKIDIKPMPKDLFPSEPPATPAGVPVPAPAGTAAPKP
jgi:peptidyl-prolyl cis-trans isomerase C